VGEESLKGFIFWSTDAGKSTIGGQIMFLTGMVDRRTLEKYEREAKEKNRESWYLSWVVDTNLEEREKGKTVEVSVDILKVEFRRMTRSFTLLDILKVEFPRIST
jgi:peptide chain release factor subunit 3